MPLAVFEDVVKDYPQGMLGREKLRAVNQVRFQIEPGEVFGLIGPNRAGKTTLVKLLLSLCRPTAGRILRLGKSADDRSTLAQVGYVHENPAFPRYLTATALLHYYGALSLLTEDVVRPRAAAWLERVGLADRAHEQISRFSKGMVQRLGLAQALINDPTLLVLDEPNEGLDLIGRQLVRDIVRERKQTGKSVLFVSHVLPEVEGLCDRVAVIVGGQVKFLGALQELLAVPGGGVRNLEDALKPYYMPAPANGSP
jgi:ABC-2 type transport system ATP-binding protein